jgi:cytochrome c-type biogenesis protein CcmH
MSKFLASVALGFACLLPAMTLGADAPSAAADPALEKRVMAISEELRCLVCQNQTIADSHAELAVDLKNQVREMLQKGQTESQIKEYMVQRYGDFVLYRPAVKSNTWMLWLGPFVLLVGALIFLLAKLKKRNSRLASEQGLSAAAQRRADQLLGINGGDSGKNGPSAVPPSVKEEA